MKPAAFAFLPKIKENVKSSPFYVVARLAKAEAGGVLLPTWAGWHKMPLHKPVPAMGGQLGVRTGKVICPEHLRVFVN